MLGHHSLPVAPDTALKATAVCLNKTESVMETQLIDWGEAVTVKIQLCRDPNGRFIIRAARKTSLAVCVSCELFSRPIYLQRHLGKSRQPLPWSSSEAYCSLLEGYLRMV